MNSAEAKLIVYAGLEKKKDAKRRAEEESKLEQYEQDMISHCNIHCVGAKQIRNAEEERRVLEYRKSKRAEALRQSLERRQKAEDIMKRHGVLCLAILCSTIFTNLPLWAAFTLAFGSTVFPAADVFRLYFPE